MKKLFTILVCISFFFLTNAQSFPKTGATWIFDTGWFPFMDANAQKWEFTGEAVSSEGVLKNFMVTTKFVNPGSYPFDTTIVQYETKQFLYKGDTIWNTSDMLSPIANFSLQLGDSSYTPYHTVQNINNLIWENCTEDSLTVFQKGVVSEVGMETMDGINSRYYVLSFTGEGNVSTTQKFSERSIIASGYWKTYMFNICSSIVEATPYALVCFFDEGTAAASCPEYQWFETLNLEEQAIWAGKIYPNPTSEILMVFNPENSSAIATIIDIQGKSVKNNIKIGAVSDNSIIVSDLADGTYVLRVQFSTGKVVYHKFGIAQ